MKLLTSVLALGAVTLGAATAAAAPPAKLLIREVMQGPTPAEHVVIGNPGTSSVPLDNYWLSDMASYYKIASGTQTVGHRIFS